MISELLSAHYLARCLEPENVCHSITTRETPKRWIKETLFTRHHNTVEPMMLADNRKATLQAIHTNAVNHHEEFWSNVFTTGCPSWRQPHAWDAVSKQSLILLYKPKFN